MYLFSEHDTLESLCVLRYLDAKKGRGENVFITADTYIAVIMSQVLLEVPFCVATSSSSRIAR